MNTAAHKAKTPDRIANLALREDVRIALSFILPPKGGVAWVKLSERPGSGRGAFPWGQCADTTAKNPGRSPLSVSHPAQWMQQKLQVAARFFDRIALNRLSLRNSRADLGMEFLPEPADSPAALCIALPSPTALHSSSVAMIKGGDARNRHAKYPPPSARSGLAGPASAGSRRAAG